MKKVPSDLQIAQAAKLKPVTEVAKSIAGKCLKSRVVI